MGSANDDTAMMRPVMTESQLRRQLADREAELAAIRMGIERLIYADFMPTTNALARALYPSPEVIARYHKKEGVG